MKFLLDSKKILQVAVALAGAIALVTVVVYGFTSQLHAGESSLIQAVRNHRMVPSMKERLEWAKEAALRAERPSLPRKLAWTARKSAVAHRTSRHQRSFSDLEKQNAVMKKEIAASAHHRQSLTSLKEENTHLKAEIHEIEARKLKRQNDKLKLELQSLEHSQSGKNGRISALASASFPMFSNRNQQELAWLGPTPKYADQPDGYNPLDGVTRAEKWKSPDYRLPLKAPEPSAGDLSEQVTGDYASFNTYANLVDNKENILWCTQEFSYLPSRIACIRRLVPAGPFLA